MIRFLMTMIIVILVFWGQSAWAQNPITTDSGDSSPVEITADDAIDWNRSNNEYRASGNVVAIQGEITVRGDALIAEYADDPQNITQLIAQDNVTITTPQVEATADRAVYNITGQSLTLTGQQLRLTTPTEIISARDKMTFDRGNNIARAIGNARIETTANNNGQTRLRADRLTGRFANDPSGNSNLTLQSVTADGNIIIRTPDSVVRGQTGRYNRNTQTADITGAVKITRGQNQLNGNRAIVNLANGDSRLIGGGGADTATGDADDRTKDDGRVRALIGQTNAGDDTDNDTDDNGGDGDE